MAEISSEKEVKNCFDEIISLGNEDAVKAFFIKYSHFVIKSLSIITRITILRCILGFRGTQKYVQPDRVPPLEPTNAPLEPTDAPLEPTDAPLDSTDPPSYTMTITDSQGDRYSQSYSFGRYPFGI